MIFFGKIYGFFGTESSGHPLFYNKNAGSIINQGQNCFLISLIECLKLSSTKTNAKSLRQTIKTKKLMIFEDLYQEERKALVTTERTFSFSRYIAKIPPLKR